MELLILLTAAGIVYGLAWAVAWVLNRVLPIPAWLRPALPWLLFHLHIVIGLFVTGDLPGAPRATIKFLAMAAGLSLLFGLVGWLRKQELGPQALKPWLLAGVLPWGAALLVEALV